MCCSHNCYFISFSCAFVYLFVESSVSMHLLIAQVICHACRVGVVGVVGERRQEGNVSEGRAWASSIITFPSPLPPRHHPLLTSSHLSSPHLTLSYHLLKHSPGDAQCLEDINSSSSSSSSSFSSSSSS